jgi:hypothetical protein
MQRSADNFLAQTAQYEAVSRRTLDHILELNGPTEFGRRFGLDGHNRRQNFERLPVTTYNDYAPLIERVAAGEQGLMSGEPVVYFSTTSGTSGPPKMIPVTHRQMRMAVSTRFTSMGLAMRAGVLQPMRGRFMTIMTEHVSGRTSGGLPKGAATTGGFRQLGNFGEMILTSPGEVNRVHDQATARYLHLLFGLREESLWTIIAFFPATILMTLRTLQERSGELLRDLADGTLTGDLDLPPEARARLLHRLKPDRRRARTLTALLERGELTVPNIWPELGAVLTATGGAFRFYTEQLQPLLGDVATFSPVYSASEGTMGFGFSAAQPYYLLVPTLAYIELLPVEIMDEPAARPVAPWQAERGCAYEVVITTLAGFTRYRLHDIVRVVDFHGETPVIEFVERRGQIIDILGEKTAEHHIVAAMEAACHALSAPLVDYFVAPDMEHSPARYLLAIEGWEGRADRIGDEREFLRTVDAALRRIAPDYDEERQLGALSSMAMVLLKPGAFERYSGKRVAAGAPASQVKTPHVVPDPAFVHREFHNEVTLRIEAVPQ